MNNIDRQYKELLEHILRFGVDKQDRTGTGTKSLFGWQIKHRMEEGFPLLTTKKMAWKSIVTELLWFLRGDTNIKYLVDNDCHIWDGDAYKNYKKITFNATSSCSPLLSKDEFINKVETDNEFAYEWGELGPIYGKQWRKWEQYKIQYAGFATNYKENRIDQIANLISELKTNPDSRRLMVNAWNVGELDQMVLPPCHYGFQVYTRELTFRERMLIMDSNSSKLVDDIEKEKFTVVDVKKESEQYLKEINIPTRAISLMWNQRSVDTFLGLPFNIASYALLLEIIAKEVNMVPEELIGNLGDCHLYSNHIEQAKEQLTRSAYDLPKVNIKPTLFEFGKPDPKGLDLDYYSIDNFELIDYKSHPSIKAPLSN